MNLILSFKTQLQFEIPGCRSAYALQLRQLKSNHTYRYNKFHEWQFGEFESSERARHSQNQLRLPNLSCQDQEGSLTGQ